MGGEHTSGRVQGKSRSTQIVQQTNGRSAISLGSKVKGRKRVSYFLYSSVEKWESAASVSKLKISSYIAKIDKFLKSPRPGGEGDLNTNLEEAMG